MLNNKQNRITIFVNEKKKKIVKQNFDKTNFFVFEYKNIIKISIY